MIPVNTRRPVRWVNRVGTTDRPRPIPATIGWLAWRLTGGAR